ncbi:MULTISPECIES: hypothetical protein [Haloarcula]|uniref:hypothetical protein n=1 Tax=Haloarcula TaxID=2237 RepID=UPI0023EDD089|nr:hypothetical protein [Halomicroarcula sp. XH51]
MPHRRALLATVASAVGAGCVAPAGRDTETSPAPPPESEPSETAGLTDTHTHTETPDCDEGVNVSAERFDPVEQLPLSLEGDRLALVERAVEDGTTTVESYTHRPPVPSGAFVAHRGRYYRLDATTTNTTAVTALVLNVEWQKGQSPPDDATTVQFGALPQVDQRALDTLVFGAGSERRDELPAQGLSVRKSPVPYPDGLENSRFAGTGDVLWVRWRDRWFRVWSGGRPSTERFTHEVGATAVAPDRDAFGTLVREQYRIPGERFSAAERDVLRAARADQYRECVPVSRPLTSLRETLTDDARLPPPFEYSWLVGLEGDSYLVETLEWVV